jgi:hypothetical protein
MMKLIVDIRSFANMPKKHITSKPVGVWKIGPFLPCCNLWNTNITLMYYFRTHRRGATQNCWTFHMILKPWRSYLYTSCARINRYSENIVFFQAKRFWQSVLLQKPEDCSVVLRLPFLKVPSLI